MNSELLFAGFLVVILGFLALFSLNLGALFYLICSIVFPVIWISRDLSLRFELVYILLLIAVLYAKKMTLGAALKWNNTLTKYLIFLMVLILSTLFTLTKINFNPDDFYQIILVFYGYLRPFLVMLLFANINVDQKWYGSFFSIFVLLSLIIATLSIGQTAQVKVFNELTNTFYTSLSRTSGLTLLRQFGFILRSTGVFETPVFNAVYFIISLSVIISLLIFAKKFINTYFLYLAFLFASVAGISTLTASFALGFVAVILLLFFLLIFGPLKFRKKSFKIIFFGLSLICCAIVLFSILLLKNPFVRSELLYQINRISTLGMFQSRYNPDTGIFRETFSSISESPIIGWGFYLGKGFVGDSVYVGLLYEGGIIGLGIFLWILFGILKKSWEGIKTGYTIHFVVFVTTIMLILLGIGSPSFYIPRLMEWYWALVGLSSNKSIIFIENSVNK